jgi:hypothetical protein
VTLSPIFIFMMYCIGINQISKCKTDNV